MAITCCWVCHHVQNCEAMLGWSSESTNLSEESKEQPHMGFVLSWAKDNERTCGPSGPNKTRTASNKHVWIYLFYMWPRDTGVRVCVHKDKCAHVVSACVYVALVKKKEKILHKPFRLSLLFCEIPREKKAICCKGPPTQTPLYTWIEELAHFHRSVTSESKINWSHGWIRFDPDPQKVFVRSEKTVRNNTRAEGRRLTAIKLCSTYCR